MAESGLCLQPLFSSRVPAWRWEGDGQATEVPAKTPKVACLQGQREALPLNSAFEVLPDPEAPDSSSHLDSWCFPRTPASEPLSRLCLWYLPSFTKCLSRAWLWLVPYLLELSGKAAAETGTVSGCPEELLSRHPCRGATEQRSEGELELLQGRRKGRERGRERSVGKSQGVGGGVAHSGDQRERARVKAHLSPPRPGT